MRQYVEGSWGCRALHKVDLNRAWFWRSRAAAWLRPPPRSRHVEAAKDLGWGGDEPANPSGLPRGSDKKRTACRPLSKRGGFGFIEVGARHAPAAARQ